MSAHVSPSTHCPRCARSVSVVAVWPGFVWAKRAWYAGLLVLACLMPVIMSEITLLLPLAMMFAAAAGPVHMLSAQRDSCSECGLELGGRNARAESRLTAATKTDSKQTP